MKVPFYIRAFPHFAERAWFTPPPLSSGRRAKWLAELGETNPIRVPVNDDVRNGYSMGEGPVVFLVHGWGGRASQMAVLAKHLAEGGFRAVAIDAPGHGEEKLDRTDIFEMAEAVRALVDEFGTPRAVVAHSLGSMATAVALKDSFPERLVFLAPVLDVREALSEFARRAQLFTWTAKSLNRRIRRYVGVAWDGMAAGSETDLGESELLIVHDPADSDTPFSTSAALAMTRPNTRLYVAEGLGHNRVVSDARTNTEVLSFLQKALASPAATSVGSD